RILNAPAGTVMMHQNVSTLTSILISGLEFKPGREKVVVTELNFPSVVYNWMAQRQRGATIEVVKSRDGLTIDAEDLTRGFADSPIAVAIGLVLFRSSGIIDVEPVIEAAHRRGAYVILDVYQGIGAVPIDVQKLGVDFAIGGSVKWLCGGPGAAYLYAPKELIARVSPSMTRWVFRKRPFHFPFRAGGPAPHARPFIAR